MTEAKGSNIWQLSETCYANLSIGMVYCLEEDVLKEYSFGKKQKYAPKILELFLKEQGRQLSYDAISRYAWEDRGNAPANEHDIQLHVGKLNAMGELGSFISNIPLEGYVFHCPGLKEIDRIPDLSKADPTQYFEALWKKHYRGIVRDQMATGSVRELIDFYVVPSIISADNAPLPAPFSSGGYSYVTAGSGFGKTTLLHMAVLVNVIDGLKDVGSEVISENSRAKYAQYQAAKTALFGEGAPRYFPVFIYADAANTHPYDSLLDLADACAADDFARLVSDAEKAGSLLFLIDSIDEVENEKMDAFLSGVQRLLKEYPNASAIFTSRFLGKKQLPFACRSVHIEKLSDDAVWRITRLMLSAQDAKKLIGRFQENEYLHSLVKNPFMLTTILEIKGERLLCRLLESIVNAVIDQRWDKRNYDISTEDIKLLLGHLACRFIYGDLTDASINDVRRSFLKAEEMMAQYGVEFHIPERNLDRFLRMLSCQSGILNITNQHHVEKYVFQDELVMCWLAANYIYRVLSEAEGITDRAADAAGIWSNALWIERFLHNFAHKDAALSEAAVNSLILVLVACGGPSGRDLQKSILYYLLFKDATSLSAGEKGNIAAGYRNILANTFGENDIANHPDSDCRKLICAMQRI